MARLILGRGVLHTPACGDEWGAGRHGGRPLRDGVFVGLYVCRICRGVLHTPACVGTVNGFVGADPRVRPEMNRSPQGATPTRGCVFRNVCRKYRAG